MNRRNNLYIFINQKIFFVACILSVFLLDISAQSTTEIQSLKLPVNQTSNIKEGVGQRSKKYQSSILAGRLFVLYKRYVSSQDYGNCSFTPSCSEYALEAIDKQGYIFGILNTFDRLTRCHGKNNPHYFIHKEKDLLIDDVKDHRNKKP